MGKQKGKRVRSGHSNIKSNLIRHVWRFVRLILGAVNGGIYYSGYQTTLANACMVKGK